MDSCHNIGVQLMNENRVENSQNIKQYQLATEQSAFFCVVFIEENKFFTLCNRYTVVNEPTQTNLNVQNPSEDIVRCSYSYIAPDDRAYVLTYIGNEYQYQIFIRDYQTGLLIYPRIYEGLGAGFARGYRKRIGKGKGGNLPHKFTNTQLSLIGGFY